MTGNSENMYKKRFQKWNLDQKNNMIRKRKQVHTAATTLGLFCPMPTQIPSTPATPEILQLPELLLVMIRDYITGSFDAGIWASEGTAPGWLISSKGGNDLKALNTMARYNITACDLLDAGLFGEAGHILDRASAEIKNILSVEHPQTLPVLFDVVMTLQKRKRPEIAQILLKQFSSMAVVVLPKRHPLGQVCGYFAIMDAVHFQNILVIAWRSLLDHFDNRVGSMNHAISECHLRFSYTAEFPNDLERGERILRNLLSRFLSTGPLDDSGCLYLLLDIEWNLPHYGKYDGAESICQTILDLTSRTGSGSCAMWLRPTTLYYLAAVQYAQHKVGAAVLTLQQTIDLNTSFRGEQDALTLKALAWLERCFMISGNNAAAAEVSDRMRTILSTLSEAN